MKNNITIKTTHSCNNLCKITNVGTIKTCPFCGTAPIFESCDPGVPYPGCYVYIDCPEGCFEEVVMQEATKCVEVREAILKILSRWNKRA